MNTKQKLIIFSSSYPYGLTETFLHNEIQYLARFFSIEIYPLLKHNESDKPHNLPNNVIYHSPFLNRSYKERIYKGIFNLSPLWIYLKDLKTLLGKSTDIKYSLKQWFVHLITYRALYAMPRFKNIFADNTDALIYFYWGIFPIKIQNLYSNPVFIRVHGGEVDLSRHKGYIPLLRSRFLKRENLLYIPISNMAEQKLKEIDSINYSINRLGVYDHGLNPQKEYDQIVIVSCSNVIALKRIHLIVEALKKIKDQQIRWIHFGDGPLWNQLKKDSLELSKNIDIDFKGRVNNKVVMDYFKNYHVDLFINVSETEGIPVSIMEAFSFGIPCFATDVGGTSEIVNNKNGKLVNKNFDSRELSNFIINIKNLSKQCNYRQNARKTWEDKCSAFVNYEDLKNIFLNKYDIETKK